MLLALIDLAVLAPALAAIVTAGAASIVTYFSVRRAKSGQIRTSEADVLWDESRDIRRHLAEQVQRLETQLSKQEVDIAKLRAENAGLKHEVLTLRQENQGLTVQVESLRTENIELRAAQGGTQ